MFLPGTLTSVLVRVVNESQTQHSTFDKLVTNDILECFVELVTSLYDQPCKVVHRTVNLQIFCEHML